jgi:hypothetical protein
MMDAAAKGTVSKSLRWSPAPDGRGYYVNVTSSGGGGAKTNVSVSLSKAEYYVFETVGRARVWVGRPLWQQGLRLDGGRRLGAPTPTPCAPLPRTHTVIRTQSISIPRRNHRPPQLGRYAIPYMLGIDMVFST